MVSAKSSYRAAPCMVDIKPVIKKEKQSVIKKEKPSERTEVYEAVIREEWRREQQRKRMVRWRVQKKEQMVDLNRERQRLEREVQRRLADVRRDPAPVEQKLASWAQHAFHQVTMETAALKSENLALCEAIDQHVKFEAFVQKETDAIQVEPQNASTLPTSKTASPHQKDLGWRVFFPNDEPSFHFYPFTEAEFDDIQKHNDEMVMKNNPCVATVGKLFGWTVDYAPLTRNEAGTLVVAHARFSRRLHCSLDHVYKILPHMDKSLWPVIATPRSWGRVQSGNVCCQVLQSLDENAHVMVSNIPGPVHLRYISFAKYVRQEDSEGRRMDTYAITIADSEANASRSGTEDQQDKVEWIKDGGTFFVLTEVDKNTIDVVYHHWAGCLSEAHGRELYIDWIRFPVLMEQYVSPARLLAF
ncbi:hypothetical protein PHYBOEH_001295 [Phytophthora boehmeriae]|uniref:Uncharacterized protein n=1 Tax=Phytophthora boehmeriae TaxID=109152 RepID=A0A8T1WVD3_9STRA|nr:hypothetical protein PHYBOEH_001295 [Phytophthora boehmeriae]